MERVAHSTRICLTGMNTDTSLEDDYFSPEDGKITGFDWNFWAEFKMTRIEVEAILKHTLDLRLKGNRAPFLIGMHSDMYSSNYKKQR